MFPSSLLKVGNGKKWWKTYHTKPDARCPTKCCSLKVVLRNIPYQTRCQMSSPTKCYFKLFSTYVHVLKPEKLHQVLFAHFVKNYLWFVSYQTRPWTWSALCSEYLRCVSRNPGKRRINVTICHFITQPRTGKHALSTHCCHCCDIRSQIWKEYDICVLSFCTQHSTEAEPIMIKH